MLKIKNLDVYVGSRRILKEINLNLKKNEVAVLLGPNGSGKTTLVKAIVGLPDVCIKKGKIFFRGKDITSLPPEGRVKMGIGVSFQHPPPVKGVNMFEFIKKISRRSLGTIKKEFLFKDLLKRELNVDFSGGELKISELMQLIALDPKVLILDEIDSGLDIQKIKRVANLIRKYFIKKSKALLLITHTGQIMKYIKPSKVHVMLDGKIVCTSNNWKRVWEIVNKYGYEKCKKCKLSSSE